MIPQLNYFRTEGKCAGQGTKNRENAAKSVSCLQEGISIPMTYNGY
jgi:hypothetical protein